MNNTKCEICKSETTIKLFEFNTTQHIYVCNNCGVEFLTPQLNDDELTKLYSENYYLAWGLKGKTENESIKRMKISTFQMRLDLIKQFVNSGTNFRCRMRHRLFFRSSQK